MTRNPGRRAFEATGRALRKPFPSLDFRYWQVGRWRHTRGAAKALGDYVDVLRAMGPAAAREPHLVVVPDYGPRKPNWHVGGGNIFFEVWRSAREVLGEERVTLFAPEDGEREDSWHRRLLQTVVDSGATHVIIQPEHDPYAREDWSWDVVAAVLAQGWDGVLIGFMYDSAYAWLQVRARRLAKLLPNYLIADLCVPPVEYMGSRGPHVGPMTMPYSQASIAAVDDYVAGMPKEYDVTFIGALYDYRVELLDTLRSSGFDVKVNPHREDRTTNYLESRANQPSYLDYMAGLARSELTINFSLASGGPYEQYKIRVHEAALVGCLCLTDDRDRSRHFFDANEFAFFDGPGDLPRVVAERLSDRDRLHADQASARERARELSRTDYWGRIETGLRRRGLPSLTGIEQPNSPHSHN